MSESVLHPTHHESMTPFQQFIHMSRYSRWNDDLNRREHWGETVRRYIDFFRSHIEKKFPDAFVVFEAEGVFTRMEQAIFNLDTMPSMRSLMTAGKALDRDNVAGYNCSYIAIDDPRAFDEILYISMCGTGVGFSVERQCINKLPTIAEEFFDTDTVIQVKDSKIGWASSFRELISLLYSGLIPKWDTTRVRGSGARLRTFGGRASGPAPLENLFRFTIDIFRKAAGRKLNSIEVHDIVCKIADIVVSGGVRRSALISLSNLSDDRMRNAKNGQWWMDNGQRALANNSVSYTERPDFEVFLKEWFTLYESRSGERGIFNRVSATEKARVNGRRRVDGFEYGTNPCGEIVLRSNGFCNLSECVVRPEDDLESLKLKVEMATIIGTFQSTLTDFRYIRSKWKTNAEEERLLGVSLTGIMDNPLMWKDKDKLTVVLSTLRDHAIAVNKKYADVLGINPSAAITTVKPSGTVSKLVNSASGIHPVFSHYYIQRVRQDKKDPLAQYLKELGVPCEDDVTKPDSTYVFSFPIKAAKHAVTIDHTSSMDQLELYRVYREHWCEHNPSITVYYRDNGEFLNIGGWVYDNFNEIGGVTFLPKSDHIYQQAPYEAMTKEQYQDLLKRMPVMDWNKLAEYEKEDQTTSARELACMSGACELV